MVLEFPDDPACRTLDRQYMLGPDLLVAPVMSPGGEVEVYIPEGEWTHLLTGETVTGPCWRHETHYLHSLPLYVLPGAVLPLAADDSRPPCREHRTPAPDPRPLLAFGGSRNHRLGIAHAIEYGSLHPLSPQYRVVRRASEGLLERHLGIRSLAKTAKPVGAQG